LVGCMCLLAIQVRLRQIYLSIPTTCAETTALKIMRY
jgi:hypothetical protein